MYDDWLTVKMVEGIHQTLLAGRSVTEVVDHLRGATLPALLEYGCLRQAFKHPQAPVLPQAIVASPLGQALSQVRSELGFRTSGPQCGPQQTIEARPFEFCVIGSQQELESRTWQEFEIRFDRSAQSVGFGVMAAHGLQAALHEMVENALDHAQAPIPALVGYKVIPGVALFSVVDVGQGVLASLRTNPEYFELQQDKDAVRLALQDGVSRYGANRGGLGFREVFKALLAQWGLLRFRSGNGSITMNGNDLDAHRGEARYPPSLPGFQLTVCCRTTESCPSEPLI